MKSEKEKKTVLDQLRQLPIAEVALKKTNISRATFYRWKKDDPEFARAVSEAIVQGENLISDMSESQLIGLIRDKNFSSIQLWLKTHHPKYANKLELSGGLNIKEEPLTEEQKQTVEEGLRLAGTLINKKLKEYEQQL